MNKIYASAPEKQLWLPLASGNVSVRPYSSSVFGLIQLPPACSKRHPCQCPCGMIMNNGCFAMAVCTAMLLRKEKRFKIFKGNVEFIESFNSIGHSYELSLNKFADLSNEQFTSSRNGYKKSTKSRPSAARSFAYKNFD
uniref:Cathepsin propeptide inhibitor domain-containing protein n=1 Tax=Nelumbo nucifera TaxID=4432 RepID=A0A822Y5C2_NELNU|nr:TPA_asm: hypothetical protein HUJ06_026272 [Nelumbo nucifera]